ncbi:hypothetical protein [Bradyrhizobium sp. USDA 4486]
MNRVKTIYVNYGPSPGLPILPGSFSSGDNKCEPAVPFGIALFTKPERYPARHCQLFHKNAILEGAQSNLHPDKEEEAMVSERGARASRFVVRMGGTGWMVYDRERKGPALIGTDWAANLTKEQAERAYRTLSRSVGEPEGPPT